MDIYNTDYTQAEGPKRGELEEFLRKDREVAEAQRENFRKAVKLGVKLTLAPTPASTARRQPEAARRHGSIRHDADAGDAGRDDRTAPTRSA